MTDDIAKISKIDFDDKHKLKQIFKYNNLAPMGSVSRY